MPASKATALCPVPPALAWQLARDPSRWAAMMPGYAGHVVLNPNHYRWTIKRNLGFIAKAVVADVEIVEEDASRLWAKFTLKGVNEPFQGGGEVYFEVLPEGTRLNLDFHITAQGALGPMINPVLAQHMPKVMDNFAARMAEWIAQAARDNPVGAVGGPETPLSPPAAGPAQGE